MMDVDRPAGAGTGTRPACWAAALLLLLAAPAARGGGFAVSDQGAKAMALGGAFTAQADDGSTLFYNAGGLALLDGGSLSFGAVAEGLGDFQVQGRSPGIAAGTTGDSALELAVAGAHAYWVQRLRPRLSFGIGLFTPFHLDQEWAKPDTFAGRTLSLSSQIRALDVNPTAAVRLGKAFGLGIGVVLRTSDVSTTYRLQRPDPLGDGVLDVGSMALDSDMETGIGWNLGLQQQVSHSFAWGVAYRSAIDVDYAGAAKLTQIATGNDQFDALLADSLPFDQDLALRTSIGFPATAGAGVAFAIGNRSILELDAGWTEWSRIQQIPFVLPNDPDLSSNVELRFDDTMDARLGFLVQTASGAQWRAGFAFEESPQPDETVGPFFAGADRTVLSVGFGKDWLDVALAWVQSDDRVVRTNVDGFNGNWSADALRLGITVRNVFGKEIEKLPKAPKVPEAPKLPAAPKLPGDR